MRSVRSLIALYSSHTTPNTQLLTHNGDRAMGIETCEQNDIRSKSKVEIVLGRMEVGETIRLAEKVVCRWTKDEFEVVTYGRHHFRLRDAATLIVD